MKKINIFYWIFTSLFAFAMLGSGISSLLMPAMSQQGFNEMHMPTHLIPFLSIAKILGAITILIPASPRLKEWAYAGLMFDLFGAIWCVAHVKSAENWAPIFLFVAVGFTSYFLYHARLKAKTQALAAR